MLKWCRIQNLVLSAFRDDGTCYEIGAAWAKSLAGVLGKLILDGLEAYE